MLSIREEWICDVPLVHEGLIGMIFRHYGNGGEVVCAGFRLLVEHVRVVGRTVAYRPEVPARYEQH